MMAAQGGRSAMYAHRIVGDGKTSETLCIVVRLSALVIDKPVVLVCELLERVNKPC
jgi:hypothetical protein